MLTIGIWRIGDLNLGISFWDAASWRVVMVLGMPFLFVPISVMSYVGVPQEKNNEVSGMTALARNIGGSLGVSFISTMLVRRALYIPVALVKTEGSSRLSHTVPHR